ncbi:hypothetical protein TELCIR_18338 [Teladorsagia circumcincta]|uniref:Trehalase n=1 Tax=Teladorsagia circumcincta TaxID=45464 RepID=A0A2G9TQB0_TELCI|nr:hypothetical protein TELCIR_18338 [Teladorsagia circumcincta]
MKDLGTFKKLEFILAQNGLIAKFKMWGRVLGDKFHISKAEPEVEQQSCLYNVIGDYPRPGHGGEYDVQDGFGWTNGVILDLLVTYNDRLRV